MALAGQIVPSNNTADRPSSVRVTMDTSRKPKAASTKDKVTPFKSLGRRKAYEEVADQIRERIFSQHLSLGDRLPGERELAEQFSVSRVVVREAVRTLELNGLLSIRKGPKGGIFVAQDYDRPISDTILNLLAGGEASLENLFEMRELIEPFAAARAAILASDEDIANLEASFEEAERVHASEGNIRPHNLEFHRQIMRMSRNPILSVVGETVLTLLSERIKYLPSPETSEEVLSMHKKILAALRQRQTSKASNLMSRDIQAVAERFARMNGRSIRAKAAKE